MFRHLFVDYAHTPDALASILETLSRRVPARLITVFGCGGDRDRTKRPLMGQIACRYSHVAIVTSDNPRTEAPDAIVDEILAGIREDNVPELTVEKVLDDPGAKGFIRVTDRRAAIETAIAVSRPDDTVVVAGKGHETYQITNQGTIHFDDAKELAAACNHFEQRFAPTSWTCDDLLTALETDPVINTHEDSHRFSGIGTDSRTLTDTDVFLALKGESFDGHTFISSLLEKGVRGIIGEKGCIRTLDPALLETARAKGLILFEVPDTFACFRQAWQVPAAQIRGQGFSYHRVQRQDHPPESLPKRFLKEGFIPWPPRATTTMKSGCR